MSGPFPVTSTTPGRGVIDLARVLPQACTLRQVSYQYPLKLVAPDSLLARDGHAVQTVYLLTYGGGIVAGDTIDLAVSLEQGTRLVLLTQGSTKIFKSPRAEVVSYQRTSVLVNPGAFLCYLPDPVQPFRSSCFNQQQVYEVLLRSDGSDCGTLCVLDWVCQGRTARSEVWDMWQYTSRNDIWLKRSDSGGRETHKRLLIRDNLVLHDPDHTAAMRGGSFAQQMHSVGVYGTLMLYGPKCGSLARFFVDEFKLIPRIGARKWDADDEKIETTPIENWRSSRHEQERADGLLWTVTTLRGCTIVKFGATEVEGGKRWLKAMLEMDGTVAALAGEHALMCLR